jgi:hypothetical protein
LPDMVLPHFTGLYSLRRVLKYVKLFLWSTVHNRVAGNISHVETQEKRVGLERSAPRFLR